ncbi:MAG TPA: L-threonylcarbamoyladenylate synthase [Aestuariivirgaceae bacterium]|jgi:L-threonylcarbamoyladenylate synthase|nr:L-threonylcarbamoyladenylate synthase [Aestuariivirgaceae bacterium]
MTIVTHDPAVAAGLLEDGALVAFPTETVYGLGADASNDAAVARLFEAKGRPSFNPLIIHVASVAAAAEHGAFNATAEKLAEAFWPGPLTLVVARRAKSAISPLATAGLDSVGLRLPAHPMAQRLLALVGRPIAAPSANPSGRLSPTLPEHVVATLGERIAAVLDGGPTAIGVESTIVSCLGDGPALHRPGGVPREAIEAVLGRRLPDARADADRPTSPGQLASHYAPRASLRLNATAARPDEVFVTFGASVGAHQGDTVALSESGDLIEAAANLFRILHQLDRRNVARIAIMPIPETGLGLAINDRLRRAAASR